MKILVYGSVNTDNVYSLKSITKPKETAKAEKLEIFPGGKGLNQAIALAKAGADTYFAGCIGKDGIWLRDYMKQNGINVDNLSITEEKTGHAIIQIDNNAQNAIFVLSGANGENSRERIDKTLSEFEKGDYIVLQNEINNVNYIIEKAHEKGIKTVLNPSPMNEAIKAIDLSKVDILILNEVEATEISKKNDYGEFLTEMNMLYPDMTVILTLGGEGSIYFDKNTKEKFGIRKVKAVDTTAAGDTFSGYVLSCLSKGFDYKKAMTYATVASSIAVSRKGAAVSVPLFREVEKTLKEER